MIRQASAGIYSWLPLGFRVLKKIEQIVREEQDRSGAIEMLMPTIQSADLWRESKRYDAYGPEMLRFEDRHDREMLYGPTNEELITADLPRRGEVLPRSAAQPLSHPVEVPRRGAPALRRHARPRVPDEGRLFLRRQRGGGAALLQQDVRRLPAHVRAHGAQVDPDGGRHGPDRRRSQPRVHHPGRDRREPASTATPISSRSRAPPADVDFERRPRPPDQAVDAALRRDRREARCRPLRDGGAGRQARLRARHRGRPHFLLRHQVFRAHGRAACRGRTGA